MKFLYALMLLVFLASCTKTSTTEETGITVDTPTPTVETPVVETPVDETIVNDIVEATGTLDETASNEVQSLNVSYKDPAGTTEMKIEYALAADKTIASIAVIPVSGTDGFIKGFNVEAQKLVGKTLSDAESFYVAGSSLTSDAFTKALKNI